MYFVYWFDVVITSFDVFITSYGSSISSGPPVDPSAIQYNQGRKN